MNRFILVYVSGFVMLSGIVFGVYAFAARVTMTKFNKALEAAAASESCTRADIAGMHFEICPSGDHNVRIMLVP